MAFLYDGGKSLITKSATGVLDQADFDRQLDVYRLAKRKDPQAIRLWNDFGRDNPDMARLVAKFDAADRADRERARERIDAVLAKSESGAQRPLPSALSVYSPDPAERQAAWLLERQRRAR